MRNILKAELYKQRHSFQSYLNFIIYILISGACIAFSLLTYSERPISMVNTLNWLTPVFLVLITATLATIDIENHTLKNLLASGISRKNIYLGKLVATLVITLIYVLFSGVMIAGGSFFSVAMHGSLCGDANVGSLVLRYALEVIAMFMYTLLFFGVSMLFKSNKNAMTVNIIIISVIPMVQGILANALNLPIINTLRLTEDLSTAFMDSAVTTYTYINIAIFVALIIITNVLGYIRFKKTDV